LPNLRFFIANFTARFRPFYTDLIMIEKIIDFSYYTKVSVVFLFPLFFVFLMCMIDLKKTKLYFSVFTSNSYFYTYPIEVVSKISLYYIAVLGFISMILAFLLTSFLYTDLEIFEDFAGIYCQLFLFSIIYLIAKHFLLELIYVLSNKKTHHKQMLSLEISYLTSISMVVYVICFYGFLHLNHYSIWSNVLLISGLVLYSLRLLALFSNNKILISGKLLYIILYLCILEIIPFVYLFKGYID